MEFIKTLLKYFLTGCKVMYTTITDGLARKEPSATYALVVVVVLCLVALPLVIIGAVVLGAIRTDEDSKR